MAASDDRYHADFDPDNTNDSHALMIRMVGHGKRVLDVGCWTGEMAAALLERNNSVAGIELDPDAAKKAATTIPRVLVGNVEELDLRAEFGPSAFDVVVFGDVLEHLVDPLAVLRKTKAVLAPRGEVVASIPNVAHGSVRLRLLDGRFEYTDVGLLDRTHLRFFTRETVLELFADSGYAIVEVQRTTIDPTLAPEAPINPATVDPALLEAIRRDEDAFTYQFVVRAVPDDDGGPLTDLFLRTEQYRREARRLRHLDDGTPGRRSMAVGVAGSSPADEAAGVLVGATLEAELGRRLDADVQAVVLPPGPEGLAYAKGVDALLHLGEVAPDRDHVDASLAVAGDEAGVMTAAVLAALVEPGLGARQARRQVLQLLGRCPAEPAVCAVGDFDLRVVPAIARIPAVRDGAPVLVLGSTGETFVRALEDRLSHDRVWVAPMPWDSEDLVALLESSVAVVTTSATTAGAAHALGVPHALVLADGAPGTVADVVVVGTADDLPLVLDEKADRELRAETLARLQLEAAKQLDAAAARLSPILSAPRARRTAGLAAAHDALRRRLDEERTALASLVDGLEETATGLNRDVARVQADNDALRTWCRFLEGRIEEQQRAIVAFQASLLERRPASSTPAASDAGEAAPAPRPGLARRVARRLRG